MPPKRSRRRPVDIDDITRIKFVRTPVMAPDEESVVFVVETTAPDRKKYLSHLWRCRVDGSGLRQLTFGDRDDSTPVISPDGRLIAFVGKRGEHLGIHLLPSDGGEARPLVEKDGRFASLVFTPDGTTIIGAYRANDPVAGPNAGEKNQEGDREKPPQREAPVCRHITRLWYRLDGEGFLPRDRWHIWAFDVATGVGRLLTKGRFDDVEPSVSPDGRLVAFVSNRQPDPDHDLLRQDLFVVPVRGGKARVVPTPAGPISLPSFSPDGQRIAYYGHTDPSGPSGATPFHLWVVGVHGRLPAKDITPKLDREPSDQTISDTGEGFAAIRPQWSPDGRTLTCLLSDTGATLVARVPERGGEPIPILRGQWHVQYAAFGHKGTRAALLVSTAERPAEIGIIDLNRGQSTPLRITGVNDEWLRTVQISRPQEVWFTSTGKTRVQGWILKPPNFRTGRRYPAIVEIHGGPATQYGYTFFHEMQLLAARGYVVFYCNPRGSQGRGKDWVKSIIGRWGTVDYEDIMAGTDWLVAQKYVDSRRVGVTGGSYGGYMTNWIVGHTNRFRAAVTQRSVVFLPSFVGTSDFGFEDKREFGGHPWENPKEHKRMSPLTYAQKIRTPLLISHAEHDWRCNIEQGEQLYSTLKILKRTVEMVRWPEEPHGLSRHGRPDRRVARLGHILRWFDKYLRR